MKIAVAQINTTVGDITGNTEKIIQYAALAQMRGAELVVFPEMTITGYPPRDLLERKDFVDANLAALNDLAPKFREIAAVVGYVERNTSNEGRPLYNAAALLEEGEIASVHYKSLLPTYDVFDEDRYFEPAAGNAPVKTRGSKVAITICEDMWTDEICGPRKLYHRDPIDDLVKKKVQLLINISASPWAIGKEKIRLELVKNHATKHNLPVVLCNQVGGNDELLFDGCSAVVAADGRVLAMGRPFEEDMLIVDLGDPSAPAVTPTFNDIEMVYKALVLGTRDYARKCGFRKAVVGLSGGIDSALTACIAADALGKGNVLGVAMPSPISSEGSRTDAERLARNLGIELKTIAIGAIFDTYLNEFKTMFPGAKPDVTEENIQARIRGNLLMAISNKLGHLVLTTGNKSEISTGYCTLYGDMCGGLAVLADIPKTMVYRLSKEVVNKKGEVIPTSTITKPPSAELRPNQKDSDSLPEYDALDPIVKAYVEEGKSPDAIAAEGHDAATVRKVALMVERNEYKRRQAAPCLKVTTKAFGVGRRIPIVHKFGK